MRIAVFILTCLVFRSVFSQSPNESLVAHYKSLKNSTCQVVLNGTYTCTGTVIFGNGIADDEMYILTAAHCLPEDNSLASAYFIFGELPLLKQSKSYKSVRWVSNGAFELLAVDKSLDFALFRISEKPPRELTTYQLGWDVSALNPSYGLVFHYADFDLQQTALSRNTISIGSFSAFSEIENGFWRVGNWTQGRTGQGSSGAGLIDQRKHFLGGLSGSTLRGTDTIDYFYRFDYAYGYHSESDKSLESWIDRDGIGKVEGELCYPFVKIPLYDDKDSLNGNKTISSQSFTQSIQLQEKVALVGVYLTVTGKSLTDFSSPLVLEVMEEDELVHSTYLNPETLTDNRENFIELDETIQLGETFEIRITSTDDNVIDVPMVSHDGQVVTLMSLLVERSTLYQPWTEQTTNELTVFPNPTNSFTYLQISNYSKMYITDSMGKEVETSHSYINGELIIDWKTVPNGLYFLNIERKGEKKSYLRVLVRK